MKVLGMKVLDTTEKTVLSAASLFCLRRDSISSPTSNPISNPPAPIWHFEKRCYIFFHLVGVKYLKAACDKRGSRFDFVLSSSPPPTTTTLLIAPKQDEQDDFPTFVFSEFPF